MKVLVVFKNGEEIKKENVKQVFCNPKIDVDELDLIYGAFSSDNFRLSEISYYNIEI